MNEKDLNELKKLAHKIVGHEVDMEVGGKPSSTDGAKILIFEPSLKWPKLGNAAHRDIRRKSAGHEASHIKRFGGMTSVEFYQKFADPVSPGESSKNYVRTMMNIVEDELVDRDAGREIGQETVDKVNKFYVWNRQGGTRQSLAELEADGSQGKCAAFIEAVYQFSLYGKIIESYHTKGLETAAEKASKARFAFGKGSVSRTQAMQIVLDALRLYCPPPWELPPEYQPPQGNSGGSGSSNDGQQGESQRSGQPDQEDSGDGKSENQGDGQSGQGNPGDSDSQGKDDGKSGEGDSGDGKSQNQQNQNSGKEKAKKGDSKDQKDDSGEAGDGKSAEAEESDGEKDPEGSESEGGGDGSPQDSDSRGASSGEEAGDPRAVESAPEKRFEDNNLETLLRVFERVLAERSRQTGRGMPRWRVWSPGEQVSSPDEIQRYQEDDYFGIDPLKRRCVRKRDRERHLMAIFIDSSGSVNDKLFSQLYRVCGEIAEKVADLEGCFLGVGQFSGGASWVLEPTRNITSIREFAESQPKRLYSGGTTVGEIYGLLPEWFSGYESADLLVLTDGFVEDGKKLAESLEKAHDQTACEIKLHGIVFRKETAGMKTSLAQFRKAKEILPEFVRTWRLGED